MFILARATGWSEAHIWKMSYLKGLMFLHCHMLYQGCDTRWAAMTEDEAQDLDSQFNRFLKR